MNDDELLDQSAYCVVHNARRQYSLWPHDASLPAGWFDAGLVGDRQTCLNYVAEVWTELRAADPDSEVACEIGNRLPAATALLS